MGYKSQTDDGHPWIGYKLLPVEIDNELTTKRKLYRIIGYSNNSDNIGENKLISFERISKQQTYKLNNIIIKIYG